MKVAYGIVLKITVGLCLFLISSIASAAVYYIDGGQWWQWPRGGATIHYYPGYYYPHYRRSYFYPRIIYPIYRDNTINTCPLMPSYYDEAGNWVPPTRTCAY